MAIYRADHVGSFLRPPALLEARTAHAEGRIGDAELRETEDRAVLTILDLQRQIGVDVYSDGEYRRGMWITGLPAAVEGFGPGAMLNIRNWRGRPLPYVPGQTGTRHAAAAGQNPAAVIVGKLTPTRRITGAESAFLGRHAPGTVQDHDPQPRLVSARLHPGDVGSGLPDAGGRPPRPHRDRPSGSDGARGGAGALCADRLHPLRLRLHRRGAPARVGRPGRRSGPRGRREHRGRQRRHRRRRARRGHVRPAHVPRQQPEPLVRRGRVRPHRREGLRRSSTTTASCWSTTASGPAASRRSASSRRARPWSSASSRPRCPGSNRRTTCAGASTRPRSTCRSRTWR